MISMIGGGVPWGLGVAGAALWLYVGIYRMGLSNVRVTDGGIEIRNPFSRRRFVAWEEISHFDIRRWRISPYVGHVHLMSGERIHMAAVQSNTRPKESGDPNPSQKIIATLNALVVKHKTAGP